MFRGLSIFTFALVLALSACGKKDETTTAQSAPSPQQTPVAPAPSPTPVAQAPQPNQGNPNQKFNPGQQNPGQQNQNCGHNTGYYYGGGYGNGSGGYGYGGGNNFNYGYQYGNKSQQNSGYGNMPVYDPTEDYDGSDYWDDGSDW